jgi:hypothetical protein
MSHEQNASAFQQQDPNGNTFLQFSQYSNPFYTVPITQQPLMGQPNPHSYVGNPFSNQLL